MKKIVHIKISDSGWILEKLASEITNRLPYVSFGLDTDSSAEIQYYMTYGCRQDRVSPIEVALFTHKEHVQAAAEKFDSVASEVDFCIAQSLATEEIIRKTGLTNVQTISPGVDLNHFTPIVRIGIVGRTYHTGRKGENLVAQVMDIPGIEWYFTGSGWPGPAHFIDDNKLPEFYRSLDYILVPALIEGGPMCVLEALASGCKVIASPVGWVPQFPHIEFKLGDADDLRRVLLQVLDEKLALRRSVEGYTWESWANNHHNLFSQLLGRDPSLEKNKNQPQILNTKMKTANTTNKLSALVAVHGQEMTASLGGPSIRAPKTVAALRSIGLTADFISNRNFSVDNVDIVHVLNVWHPTECEVLLRQIEKNNRPSVLSPIFLDLSELNFYNIKVRQILSNNEDLSSVNKELSALRHEITAHRNKPMMEREPLPNYFASVRRLASYANHLILLSELEKNLLEKIGVSHPSVSIVKNPVDASVFNNGDPQLFRELIGVEDYVLCVGRIESRKNQALLALALRNTNVPLVLIGHEADSKYADLIRKWGGENVIFAGRIEANSPMLASAFAGAKVFCLPSWSEGAPLVALEAAAAGCNMVLSNRSSESEYFGDLARYIEPADPDDIRAKILDAWNDSTALKSARSEQLKEKMRTQHSWENYAIQTKDAYESALKVEANKPLSLPTVGQRNKRIFVDLTTMAHHNATPTGIARVESRLANELHKYYGAEIHYIVWNSFYRKFIEVSFSEFENGNIRNFAGKKNPSTNNSIPRSACSFQKDDVLLVFGGAWIRNTHYLKDLRAFKLMFGVTLVTTVYDVIQHKLKFLFPEGVGDQFAVNCRQILSISDMVLTCSDQSRKDIVDFCLETQTPLCPISVFRLGDEAVYSNPTPNIELQREGLTDLASDDKFVMFVSTIDVRKNHALLLMLWKGLISEYGDAVPKLVLVGGVGWRGEEAISILNDNPTLKDKVLMLHGIEDSTLDWLYTNCLFTVFPSRYEGWGLPVAESCRYGKFCISSNAGSLPEVAPGHAEYIDPLDCIAWYKALQKYCFNPELLAEKTKLAQSYKPTYWHSTAKQVIESIDDIHTTERMSSLSIGDKISFSRNPKSNSLKSDKFTLKGWSNNETDGTWTVGKQAILGFQFDQASKNNLALSFNAFGYVPAGEAINVTVLVNDVTVAKWVVDGVASDLLAPIPLSILQSSHNLKVELKIDNPKSPTQFGASDWRSLGLHVRHMTLLQQKETSTMPLLLSTVIAETPVIVTQKPSIAHKIKNRLRRLNNTINSMK
ncbi:MULTISPECIES: glycosyltransferase [Yersinia]|uniref:glycosyltransferase n=1 Tax=Yersinia TaxID=629 RepID=UPI0005DF16EC|nr:MULTISPECIES: glycosyltransferase [Yersinia]RXA94726.1 glycosyltransferase [Yersinia sp. 2105 StPb PI]CNK32462.1 UDP-D-galactose:(glucosyl)lipopolysaccharide-1%2 C6-D-galactosyltransferase [Yersinia frederiksenii]